MFFLEDVLDLPESQFDFFQAKMANQLVQGIVDENLLIVGWERELCHLPDEIDLHCGGGSQVGGVGRLGVRHCQDSG